MVPFSFFKARSAVIGVTSVGNNGNFVCNLNCPIGCSACTDTVCTACSTGFALASGRCNPDLSCNPICAYCPAGT